MHPEGVMSAARVRSCANFWRTKASGAGSLADGASTRCWAVRPASTRTSTSCCSGAEHLRAVLTDGDGGQIDIRVLGDDLSPMWLTDRVLEAGSLDEVDPQRTGGQGRAGRRRATIH